MFAPRGWIKRPIHREIYRVVASSSLFDADWYRSHQMDFFSRLSDPVWHYLKSWSTRDTDPSANFDSSYYIEAYPDVRASRINPLFHYEKYGRAEQRSTLRSGKEIVAHYLPFTSELTTVVVAAHPPTRTSIVIDPNSAGHSPHWGAQLAQLITAAASPVRIIVRGSDRSPGLVATTLSLLDSAAGQASIVEVPEGSPYSDLPRVPGERFIATSWSSVRSLAGLALLTPVELAHIGQAGGLELHRVDRGLIEKETLRALSPATADERVPAEAEQSRSVSAPPVSIAVYCDPLNSPLGFQRSVEFLEVFMLGLPKETPPPTVYLWGAEVEPFSLWGSVAPVRVGARLGPSLESASPTHLVLAENPIPPEARDVIAHSGGLTLTNHDLGSDNTFLVGLSKGDVAAAALELASA